MGAALLLGATDTLVLLDRRLSVTDTLLLLLLLLLLLVVVEALAAVGARVLLLSQGGNTRTAAAAAAAPAVAVAASLEPLTEAAFLAVLAVGDTWRGRRERDGARPWFTA